MPTVRKCEGRNRLHATSWKALETGQWHYIPDLHTSQSSLHPRRGQKNRWPLLVCQEGQNRVFRKNSPNPRENSGFVRVTGRCIIAAMTPPRKYLHRVRSWAVFAGTSGSICKKKGPSEATRHVYRGSFYICSSPYCFFLETWSPIAGDVSSAKDHRH